MEQIRIVGLDIAPSVFRLVERSNSADNFSQRLVSPTDSQCRLLAKPGSSSAGKLLPLLPQLQTFDPRLPLLGAKRTSKYIRRTSEFDPQETSGLAGHYIRQHIESRHMSETEMSGHGCF